MKEFLRYRDLVWYLVLRDLKVRYRRSFIGVIWTMLQPLLTMLVLALVFSSLFRFDIKNYPVYALAGILFFNFFSQSVITSMNSLSSNAALLSKVPVPMAVFPISTVISGVVNLLFALVPLFAIVVATGHPLKPALLFLPIGILISAAFTLGAGLVLAPLAAFFTDTVEFVGVLITLLMYMTPTFYPMSIVPDHLRWAIRFNPLRSVLEVFRDPIYHGKIPPMSHLGIALLVTAASLLIGYFVFRKTEDRIPLYL